MDGPSIILMHVRIRDTGSKTRRWLHAVGCGKPIERINRAQSIVSGVTVDRT